MSQETGPAFPEAKKTPVLGAETGGVNEVEITSGELFPSIF